MFGVAHRPGQAPGPLAADQPESASRPRRILLVEDDYFVALEAEHHLRACGFEIVGTATTAEEAIRIAEAEQPDLAVMDIRLAGLRDGVEAAVEIFARFGIRSIFATAHGDAETRIRAQPANPAGWLLKPYTPESLVELVKAAAK